MRIVEVLYLIAPLLVAGAVHAPVIKLDLLPVLARPLDFGLTFRGRPVFGANKTWRGVLLTTAVSVLVVFVQTRLYAFEPFRQLDLVAYSQTSWVGLGLAFGLSYSLSELPNSFVKRRLGIRPGGVSKRRAVVQYFVDQADSAVGATMALALFLGSRFGTLLLVFVVGFILHVLVDQLFFVFGVKQRLPSAHASRLEGAPTC